MKKLFLFSIGQLLKLVALLKPLIELVVDIVKVFKKKDDDDNENEDENAASKREKSGARSGSSEREQGRPKVNDNVNLKTNH